LPDGIAQAAIIDGDATCASIAAASIVAKVARDRAMQSLHERYPAYGFARHKGYATAEHLAALARHGPCPAHRRAFLRPDQLALFEMT
jgi:ribonuclease HII